MSAYNAAKGGVVNLTRSIALDFGAYGIRANSVCPSLTCTATARDMVSDPQLLDIFRERMLPGRVAEPADIAAVVALLASEDAAGGRRRDGVQRTAAAGLSRLRLGRSTVREARVGTSIAVEVLHNQELQ
jgi:NAD(P)-dependent dehydrogenase (short-subunit alcohol dehydrogenase family)